MQARFFAPRTAAILLACATVAAAGIAAAQNIKIGYIDPLSGAFANVGEAGAAQFQMVIDDINAKGGVLGGRKFELVKFDNKTSPQESLIQFNAVTDQGIRYITQGNGSSVAGALIDAVNKWNERNPDKTVLYLNYAAVDPDFTNDKCSFWHFRFDANSDMKMQALTSFIAKKPAIKKVYIFNQDYQFGKQVSKAANDMLKKKRPDIKIVGDEFIPLGKVKDFAPYVAKIKAAGADTIITGNWGNDLSLFVKAAREAGLKSDFYTYYGGGLGTPAALGAAAEGKVKQITEWHMNIPGTKVEQFAQEFKKKHKIEFYYGRINNEMRMLAAAMNSAGSDDPKKVALAMEGMFLSTEIGDIEMRKDDHQMIQNLYISTFTKADGKSVKYDVEDTGFGFKTDVELQRKETALPTTCQMKRPA
jgi:branched-chain amino acid transport system substrate-binding protein